MKYAIFSIDDQSPFGVHNFNAFLNSLESKGKFMPCIGSYKGETEWSWIGNYDDFVKFVVPSGMVKGQESILLVDEGNKQYASLLYQDGRHQSIGSLKSVNRDTAMKHDAWTFRPDLNTYWIAVEGNPDTVPPDEGWLSNEKKAAVQQAIDMLSNDLRPDHNEAAANLRRMFFPN